MIKPKLLNSPTVIKDKRGEIKINKLPNAFKLKQFNFTSNNKYIVRGMHYQKNTQNKILILLRGKILDVIMNINTKKVYYFELSKNNSTLFIPSNCAHGFQVLSEKAELLYLFDDYFINTNQIGFNILDKKIDIRLRKQKIILSEKDKKLSNFNEFKKKI